jgi:hypothetical protein
VNQSPRPYTIIVLFYSSTSETSQYVYEEYLFAAEHFKNKQTHFTQKNGKNMVRPVFFAALRYTPENMKVYKEVGPSDRRWSSAGCPTSWSPRRRSSPSKSRSRSKPRSARKMYQRQFLWEIQASDGIITAKKLVLWLSDKTGIKVEYQESLYTFAESVVYFLVFVALLWFIYTKFRRFLLNPGTWMGVFMIGYYVSCAGIVFCILNNVRWYGEKNGEVEYVDPSSRSQFISEGLMMSASSTRLC